MTVRLCFTPYMSTFYQYLQRAHWDSLLFGAFGPFVHLRHICSSALEGGTGVDISTAARPQRYFGSTFTERLYMYSINVHTYVYELFYLLWTCLVWVVFSWVLLMVWIIKAHGTLQRQHKYNFTTRHALSYTLTQRGPHTYAKCGVGRDFGVCSDAVIFKAKAEVLMAELWTVRGSHNKAGFYSDKVQISRSMAMFC